MKSMKIVICIPMEPARVELTSRMKFMRKQMRPRRQSRNVGFHHMLAGSSRIDFSMVDGEARDATFGAAQRNAQGRWEGFRERSVSI